MHKKFWQLIARLKDARFDIPGLNVEKLYSTNRTKLYSARMTKEMRLIFSMKHESAGNALIIHELNHHDAAYESIKRREADDLAWGNVIELNDESGDAVEFASCTESESGFVELQLFKVPEFLLKDPDRYLVFERNLDRYLKLSEEQEEILAQREKSFLVQAPAGTGKTTLALFSALRLHEEYPHDSVYLFTYHEELACVCRAYKVNLLGERAHEDSTESNDGGIKVFSYIEFCRRYLRRVLKKQYLDPQRNEARRGALRSEADKRAELSDEGAKRSAYNWIEREKSIDILRLILSSKPRWARTHHAEDIYGLIYSILKGRFMPGTENLPESKSDYERIFKDYGRMPEFFEDIIEVFSLYQSRLEKNHFLDEADVIRLSHAMLKQNVLLTEAERRLWIVIDEIQDFTELEWKSILLFWENHCKQELGNLSFPFLCGDTNQNISRSGFRWQELESYMHPILRDLHRPNALKKVELQQNYRNTRQIFQLGAFVRELASDRTDLGLSPELEGERPCLVVASDQELSNFLKEKDREANLSYPIVVLVENDNSLDYLRKELGACQSVFILPLRNSKGLEFEDVIIHRAFSSAATASVSGSGAESSRLFDLWYMGITRGRKNLLLVQNQEDCEKLSELLNERKVEFFQLVDRVDASAGFEKFWRNREVQVPNYNVIFLERKLAQDLWEIFLDQQKQMTDKQAVSQYSIQCRDRAIALWRRCFDYGALGRALMHLQDFEEAAIYLKRADLPAEAANCLEASKNFAEAALHYEMAGLKSDAARCYENAQDFVAASRCHEEDGNWPLAAIAARKADDKARAALLLVKAEKYLDAAELYLLMRDNSAAAHCFQKAGQVQKALELFESQKMWSNAAQLAKQAALPAKAAELFLKAQMWVESAESLEETNSFEEAADLYVKIKNFDRAAALYERAGKLEEAALMYEQAGSCDKALKLAAGGANQLLEARCREKLGEFHKAAELYKNSGAISNAASCFEKAKDYKAAAEKYQECLMLNKAGECLEKSGKHAEAARLHRQAGDIERAAHCYKQAKQWRDAGQCLEQLKNWIEAKVMYERCRDLEGIARCKNALNWF